ncbi:MAG: phytoene desaturase family protein [Gemmatimonadota bacterium]
MNSYDAVVIGAGINGLTAAGQLAGAGKRVVVLEKRASIGGAASTEELIPGFRFNTCTDNAGHVAPQLVQKLKLDLLPAEDSVTTLGPGFTLTRELNRSVAAIRQQSARDAEQWPQFARLMHQFAGFIEALYAMPAPRPIDGGTGDLFAMAMLGKRARALGRANMIELLRVMPMSVAELLDDYFESDALKATVAAQGITALHQGPFSAGTAFVLLHHHIGQESGAFRMRQRFRGGIGALVNAVASASGAEICVNSEVAQIVVRQGRAQGVVLANGEEIRAQAVVSSIDVKRTLIDLVDVAQLDPEFLHAVRHVRSRGVVARMHLALSELPRFGGVAEHALRGVISVGSQIQHLERAYDDVKYGRISARPFLEARIPSLTDPSLAPAGRHTMSVSMQYVPYDADRDAVGSLAVQTLAEHAPNLTSAIIDRRVFTPRDLEMAYGLPEGNVEHAELGLDQILFMRPLPECARHATPIENLYLCGAGTHPGRAVLGASGRLAAKAMKR